MSVSVLTEVQTLKQSSDCSATDFSIRTLFFSVNVNVLRRRLGARWLSDVQTKDSLRASPDE